MARENEVAALASLSSSLVNRLLTAAFMSLATNLNPDLIQGG